jgi:hypothetical protein
MGRPSAGTAISSGIALQLHVRMGVREVMLLMVASKPLIMCMGHSALLQGVLRMLGDLCCHPKFVSNA